MCAAADDLNPPKGFEDLAGWWGLFPGFRAANCQVPTQFVVGIAQPNRISSFGWFL